MNNEQQFDEVDEGEPVQTPKSKRSKVGFWSIVCAVAFFIMGLIEVAVMEFFTVKFTIIFVSIMAGLSAASFLVWLISRSG